jgi:hypothetical protein
VGIRLHGKGFAFVAAKMIRRAYAAETALVQQQPAINLADAAQAQVMQQGLQIGHAKTRVSSAYPYQIALGTPFSTGAADTSRVVQR